MINISRLNCVNTLNNFTKIFGLKVTKQLGIEGVTEVINKSKNYLRLEGLKATWALKLNE